MFKPNNENLESRKFSVLLITRNKVTKSGQVVVGKSKPSLSFDSELEDYIELLSGSNFSFEIMSAEEIKEDTFIDNFIAKFSVVIVAVPFSSFPDIVLSYINKASCNHGISFISVFRHVDARTKLLFGIKYKIGTRFLWPPRVKIIGSAFDFFNSDIVAEYGLTSGLAGLRRRALGKLNWVKSFVKGYRLIRSLIIPYLCVELEPDVHKLLATMKGEPLAWSFQFGKATNYYFALSGKVLLRKFNEVHRLIRAIIETNSGFGMASLDLENTMTLRLDDPGACSADYLNNGGILTEKEWEELNHILEKKKIPLSIMYTPGWVDDGDCRNGRLFVDDNKILDRKPGKIYDSACVKYVPLHIKNTICDHRSEFRGLKKFVEGGLGDVHSHGLTHLSPNYSIWSQSKNRHKDSNWYSEFYYKKRGAGKVERRKQMEAMVSSRNKILSLFGVLPCALTPSGHTHDSDCDLLARKAGYLIFSSDYTGILKDHILIRNWKIPSLFLYLKDPTAFANKSGYPFIGVVHDYEIKSSLNKFQDVIEKWRSFGIKRFISLRDLSASLCISSNAYYHVKDSLIKIILTKPKYSSRGEPSPDLTGSELHLRIIPPKGMIPVRNSLSVSGAKLLALQHRNVHKNLDVLLKLGNDPTATITLPLEPISLDQI